jgi:L-ascorbate metabolism protein UlaG (beta-lactamase superfamily)
MKKVYYITTMIVLLIVLVGIYLFTRTNPNVAQNNMANENEIQVATGDEVSFTPIEHATMVAHFGDTVIYTDPVGGASAFAGQKAPDIILITDTHGDHFDAETLSAVASPETTVILPQAVLDELNSDKTEIPGTVKVLKNGENIKVGDVTIDAIPMYNLPESADAYHVKGRGNGYVVEALGTRVYFSGDTEDIAEMRALRDIDHAFISMNLPFTMTVDQAASAVLEFKPKTVTPYHYRGPDGLADINKFRELVNAGNPSLIVDIMDFYPKAP